MSHSVLLGGPSMNLYIDNDSYVLNSVGEIETGDEVRLIDCNSCIDNNSICGGADDNGFSHKLTITLCKWWRPKYELIY